jgi:aspartyl-tRNA(Asn)/glutamyl-tRNA(Gln) amidotransferase subunit C
MIEHNMKNKDKTEKDISIDIETVQKIADLIHLSLDEDMADAFSHQFSEIIAYFQQLDSIDTNGVLSANEMNNLRNITREDLITPSISRDQFFKNVPDTEAMFVRIPKISNIK